MNTPRTKKPTRHVYKPDDGKKPDGHYTGGIANEQVAAALGRCIAAWPHAEDAMIQILSDLMGHPPNIPVRQIYYSLISTRARLDLIRKLLTATPLNRHKGPEYDEIIDDFYNLSKKRNDYAHAIYFTHESGRVFLSKDGFDDIFAFETNEVTAAEIDETTASMFKFTHRVVLLRPVWQPPNQEPPVTPEGQ